MSETIDKKIHFEVSTIETIDQSVLNFVESLNLATLTNKGFKPVPVVWGTAERAFQVKNNKDIRDQQGLLVLPIISIRRTNFIKSRQSPGVFQGNVPEVDDDKGGALNITRTIFQQKTLKFANADALRLYGQKNYPGPNPKVVYRTVSVPMPVNVEVTYEITLRTEYQQQMNDLMTPFVTKPGTINFINLTEKDHKYEGFIQPDFTSNDNLANFTSDERKFETKITLKVIGYIVGEGKNREKPHYAIRENAVEIKIPRERISLGEVPEHEYGAYYGLGGVPDEVLASLLMSPYILGNAPAASFFAGSGTSGGSSTSANVVTTTTLASEMASRFSINEILKAEDDALPGDKRTFTTLNNIKSNTETVTVNGVIQVPGESNNYVIQSGNSVVFQYDIDPTDVVQITYIKD
jgi:hypothetical protein